MLFSKPVLFEQDIYRKKRTIKWDDTRVEYFLYRLYHRTPKLIDEINKLNHKSTVGLTLACAEWVLWQFEQTEDIAPYLEIVHELWYGLIDASYTSESVLKQCGELADNAASNTAFSGCVKIVFQSLQDNQGRYLYGNHGIQYKVLSLVKLARYVAPDKKAFDEWFEQVLASALELFPATFSRSEYIRHPEDFDAYDTSKEAFIPRQFYFEPGFAYEPEKCALTEKEYYDNLLSAEHTNQNRANILLHSCLYGKTEPKSVSEENKRFWSETVKIEANGHVVDTSVFQHLPALVYLDLVSFGITDLSFLSSCPKLEFLNLCSNKISDIRPLAALTNLAVLTLYGNQITDICVLKELGQLQFVDLCKNQISNADTLESMRLGHIDITENPLPEEKIKAINHVGEIGFRFKNGHIEIVKI